MLQYDKGLWGIPLLRILRGSAIPRAIPFALVAAFEGALLELYANEYCESKFSHPYAYQSFGTLLGIAIVFRTNVAINRWWEAITNLVFMQSKWMDAAVQMMAFDGGIKEEAVQSRPLYRKAILHLLSLAHAMQLQALRSDTQPLKFVEARRTDLAPPDDPLGSAASLRQEIGSHSRSSHIFPKKSNPNPQPDEASGTKSNDSSPSRFALKQRISSERFRLIAESRKRLRWLMLNVFILPHGEEYTQRRDEADPLGVIGGMSDHELALLRLPSAHRQNIVYGWVLDLFAKRTRDGGLDIPPPILSRTAQVLSDGFLGGSQARKVAQTPFPFPHAQLITALLVCFGLTAPLVLTAYMGGWGAVTVASGTTVGVYVAINEVGRDLEDPYNFVPNCVPLSKMQWNFNQGLWAVMAGVDTTISDITQLPWSSAVSSRSEWVSWPLSAPPLPPASSKLPAPLSISVTSDANNVVGSL